jgi:Flp pilus assembly protein TadG
MILKMNNSIRRLREKMSKFAGDNRGVAALEFAMIAPLLITMYLGTMEISSGLQMNKKVGRAASTVGDLVAQLDATQLNKDALESILRIGKAVTQPYSLTQPKVTVTGIEIDAGGNPKVAWSRELSTTGTFSKPYLAGAAAIVPLKVKIASTFLVRVETTLAYKTLTSWSISRSAGENYGLINMAETYYLRPRVTVSSTSFPCSDC